MTRTTSVGALEPGFEREKTIIYDGNCRATHRRAGTLILHHVSGITSPYDPDGFCIFRRSNGLVRCTGTSIQ